MTSSPRRWCSRAPRGPARGGPGRRRSPARAARAWPSRRASSPLGELGHDLTGEQLERLADVLVLVLARLAHEDQLVDARVLVAAHQLADLVGRADGAAQRRRGPPPSAARRAAGRSGPRSSRSKPNWDRPLLELVPDVGDARAGAGRTRSSGRASSRRSGRRRGRARSPSPRPRGTSSAARTATLRVHREAAGHALLGRDAWRSSRRPTPWPRPAR